MEIKWKNETLTSFLGRNGTFKCKGVWVDTTGELRFIEPITSKGGTGRSRIVLPEESLSEVCSALLYGEDAGGADLFRLVLDNIDQKELPALLGLNKALDEIIAKKLEK